MITTVTAPSDLGEEPLRTSLEVSGGDRSQVVSRAEFLEELFESHDLIEIRVLGHGAEVLVRDGFGTLQEIIDGEQTISEANRVDSVYFSVNPRRESGRSREHVACCRALVADFDHEPLEVAILRVEDAGLPHPRVIVDAAADTTSTGDWSRRSTPTSGRSFSDG